MSENAVLALLLTLVAGLSTGIGGLLSLLYKKSNSKLVSISLGFSAGVMVYVSFTEIFFQARAELSASLGDKTGLIVTVASFFAGIALIAIIDKLVPSYKNPHESHRVEELHNAKTQLCDRRLLRTGLFTAIAIMIHNFPEGIAAFISTVRNPKLGIAIAIAIAIHNIPEGISVSIPLYCSTGSRKKALFYSFLSGLSEPFAAFICYLVLLPFINNIMLGVTFASVAGIMVFISLDELLPTAREYGEHHYSISGLIAGMAIMAASSLLF